MPSVAVAGEGKEIRVLPIVCREEILGLHRAVLGPFHGRREEVLGLHRAVLGPFHGRREEILGLHRAVSKIYYTWIGSHTKVALEAALQAHELSD
ncbi:hypothetical protein N7495_001972 [Penicillium taxi]|uniref:uncharacterized protein n=1 Tax=Penicillium taxi TaxID=168475 RepID=UPI0025452060|nr:uncharacterized protein N7495_001972 [Penicillium taxi]KAJ5901444.1 hypothetical protein N7495_001972 [Penicillium taxi]